tara:strand:- start:36 stop:356 length:321 start_codon:yes stop_codon:yes gene_type:complete
MKLLESADRDYELLDRGIDLQRTTGQDELSGESFGNLDLMNRDLSGLHLANASFYNCTFHGTNMKGIRLNMVSFFNCDLSEAVGVDKGELSEGSNAFNSILPNFVG